MSDLNLPRENRLKGKFKGLLDRFMGEDRSHDERRSGSIRRSRPTHVRR